MNSVTHIHQKQDEIAIKQDQLFTGQDMFHRYDIARFPPTVAWSPRMTFPVVHSEVFHPGCLTPSTSLVVPQNPLYVESAPSDCMSHDTDLASFLANWYQVDNKSSTPAQEGNDQSICTLTPGPMQNPPVVSPTYPIALDSLTDFLNTPMQDTPMQPRVGEPLIPQDAPHTPMRVG